MPPHDSAPPQPSSSSGNQFPSRRFRRTHPPIIRSIFVLLGVSALVPWNAFISAKDYLVQRLCDTNNESRGDGSIESVVAIIFNVASVVSVGVLLLWQQRNQKRQQPTHTLFLHEENERQMDANETENVPERIDPPKHAVTLVAAREHTEPTTTPLAAESTSSHAYYMVMGPLTLNVLALLGQSLLVLLPNTSLIMVRFVLWTSVGACGLTVSILNAGVVMTCNTMATSVSDGSLLDSYFQGQAFGGLIVAMSSFVAASMQDPAKFQDSVCRANKTSASLMTAYDPIERDDYNDNSQDGISNLLLVDIDSTEWRQLLDATSTGSSHTCAPYSEIDKAIFGYFVAGAILMALAVIGYSHVYQQQQQLLQQEYMVMRGDGDGVAESTMLTRLGGSGLEMNMHPYYHDLDISVTEDIRLEEMVHHPMDAAAAEDGTIESEDMIVNDVPRVGIDTFTDSTSIARGDIWNVYQYVAVPTWCIFLSFVVTLTIFPSWTSQLQSHWQCRTNVRLANDLYTPFTFVVFNAGDLCGRVLSGRFAATLSNARTDIGRVSRMLLTGAILRLPLAALILLTCPGATQVLESLIVPWDVYSLILQWLFAVSSGFLVTLSFAHAPKLLPSSTGAAAQERMSELLSFALSLGLLVGSFCSYPVTQLEGRNG